MSGQYLHKRNKRDSPAWQRRHAKRLVQGRQRREERQVLLAALDMEFSIALERKYTVLKTTFKTINLTDSPHV